MLSGRRSPEFAAGARTLAPGDGPYPVRLGRLAAGAPVLRVRGELREGRAAAIVGSRRPDEYGRTLARELGAGLARAGVSVVSGGALGVDGEAHQGALDAGGHTVVVMGTGLDLPYPPSHRRLFEAILRAGGAVVTEQPEGTPGFPANFPARNRIIAALSEVVVVVQAKPGSGALITAEHARRLGVPLLAVPGDVREELTAGPLELLRRGAAPVGGAEDVLRALGLDAPVERQLELAELPGGDEGALLGALSRRPRHLDELTRATGLTPGAALVGLLALELRGLVEQRPGGHFLRRA